MSFFDRFRQSERDFNRSTDRESNGFRKLGHLVTKTICLKIFDSSRGVAWYKKFQICPDSKTVSRLGIYISL